MGQYKKSTLTAAGERLVAQAIGGEIKLNITKVKTSNHQYPDGTNFKSLVDMDGIVQTMVGPKTAVYNDTLIQTRALFSNEEVKETYYIHNIGLYAMDGSEEVLFSISSATTPDEMPKYDGVAPTTCIYNIQNTISETSSVSLTINPAGYASIADIMELDEKKVDKTGDISETTINALDEPATDVQFPVPVAGESTKTFLGKVKKFFEDTKNWMTGVCLIGQIVNNCVTNNAKLPLSAAQGKVLMDLYTVLNTKSDWQLLWENPSPASNFALNTIIQIDLSGYQEILVVVQHSPNNNFGAFYQCNYPLSLCDREGSFSGIISTTSDDRMNHRTITFTRNSINFGTCYRVDTYGASTSNSRTDRIIPRCIFAK